MRLCAAKCGYEKLAEYPHLSPLMDELKQNFIKIIANEIITTIGFPINKTNLYCKRQCETIDGN